MLSNQRDPLASNQDVDGKTPLHVAVLNNQVETVQKLVWNYSKYNEIKDKNNKYPYQYAIDNGNEETLELFSHYYSTRKNQAELIIRGLENNLHEWKDYRKEILLFGGTIFSLTMIDLFVALKHGKAKSEAYSILSTLLPSSIMFCATRIWYLYKLNRQKKLLDQIDEKLNEINFKIYGVAVLNNQVEKVRELVCNYSKYNEIKDKNNKYPYQYAIDNGNKEILELFFDYYGKRKAEIELTERKFAGKVGKYDYLKKVSMIVNGCIGICVPLYVGITYFVAQSSIDIFKDSLSGFIFPTIYRIYRYVLGVAKERLHTDNKIIEILLDREQREYENLIDEAKCKYINITGAIEDLWSQTQNSVLEINGTIKWLENKMMEVNVYNGNVSALYRDNKKILEEFRDYHQQAIAIFSITMSIVLSSYYAIDALHSYYSRKCTSQRELLDQINEKLNEISHKINELEIDRLNRRVEEMSSSIEDRLNRRVKEMLSSIEQRSARVNYNDEDLDTAIQEINANMESIEVENVSASKSTEHRRSNERA